MKKKLSVLALASLLVAGSAMASGWRIPEQSVDSTAKVGANIASATRADTAYYNPAKMNWMDNTWHAQINGTYIYLSEIEYEDARTALRNDESEEEHFLLPTGFLVSPDYGGARFGLSIVEPYGLAKRWKGGYGQAFAEEFSLTVIEVNPTVSYGIGDIVSIAAGPRMLYADATVKSDASVIGTELSREMEGDTIEWGWHIGLAIKPTDKFDIAATYRSNVDLEFDERTDLNLLGMRVNPNGKVSVPAPAVFALSFAYDVLDNLNVEFTWDRTFWSEYDELDFDFSPQIPGNPFEAPLERDWDDTDAFRIGLTYVMSDAVTLMAGFGYDNNPVPTENVDFGLPDSDAWLYSIGMQYAVSEKMDVGIAALYDYKEEREVKEDPSGVVYGEFTNASALLVTIGLNYKF